jgi:hypothetical protein
MRPTLTTYSRGAPLYCVGLSECGPEPFPFRPIGALQEKYGASRDLNLPKMVHKKILARGRPLRNGSREIGSVPATDQPLKRRGSKRLQLNKGGGATPFLLQDLEDGDVNSIPTAPTKSPVESVALGTREARFGAWKALVLAPSWPQVCGFGPNRFR